MCIDPETKSATLTSNTTYTDSGDVVGYQPVCINSTDSGIKLDSNWKVAVKIDHFEILRVKGGIDKNVASEVSNNLDRYAPQHAKEEGQRRGIIETHSGVWPYPVLGECEKQLRFTTVHKLPPQQPTDLKVKQGTLGIQRLDGWIHVIICQPGSRWKHGRYRRWAAVKKKSKVDV